jgi:hypothetical protein
MSIINGTKVAQPAAFLSTYLTVSALEELFHVQ